MATFYIEEYENIMTERDGTPIQAPGTLLADQKVTVGSSSAQSAATNVKTRMIVLTADVPCQWEEGTSPTASATSLYLPADTPRAFGTVGGNLLAVIQQQ